MKSILFVQPNFRQGPKEVNAYYLPYSVGTLWAYANEYEEVKRNYKFNGFIWKRDNIDNICVNASKNHVIAFSTYVWNKNYNFELAKKIKSINPDAVLIFGGPEIEIENKNIFLDYPFIDIVVKSEGESTFKDLLINLDNDIIKIKGLLINDNGNVIDTGQPVRLNELDVLPSPYLTGVFDDLIEENFDVEWNATLETNRGCPYACTFCDWGSLTYSKVKKFDLERVYAELEWIGKNKCGFVSVTDANFGIFLERDNLIADKLLEVQDTYGYPYTFSVTWAKNQKDGVIDIVKKLTDSPKFNQGLTVSVQSMDFGVLENIKRKNLEQHKIEEILDICEKKDIPTYTEIILGLPGETLESWKNNFWKLFNAGAHTGLNIFQAQLLENAEMNLLQTKEYDIKYSTVYDYMSGSYDEDPIKEGVKIVTSTNTITFSEMLEAQIFSWYLNTFHVNGITNYISRFLNEYYNISYQQFYEKLLSYIIEDAWFFKEKTETENYYRMWMTEGKITHPKISNVEIHGWNIIYRTVLNMQNENQVEKMYQVIERFLDNTIKDKDIINDLINLQKAYFINYNKIETYPKQITLKNDILGYLENGNLDSEKTYIFDFVEDKNMKKERFLENIYFRRRRNFGKALIKKCHRT